MDGIQFADGFDAPDRLAFGLSAAQLLTVVCGGLLAFALVHAPLPGALVVPAAAAVAMIGALLGWLRLAGRPALDWALFAARYAVQPREGLLAIGTPAASPGTAAPATLRAAGADQPAQLRAEIRRGKIIPLRTPGRDAALKVCDAPATDAFAVEAAGRTVVSSATRRSGNAGLRISSAHRIVFFSLKGGTGRTTLATELTAAMATGPPRANVFLLDLDVHSACVGARLGLAQPGIVEYALAPPEERRISDFAVAHASGVRVVLGPARPADADWPVNAPVLREALRELDMDGAAVVVMDVSPQLGALTRAALNAADDVIIVVLPTASGVQDAYRTTEQLRRLGLRHRLRYVVNRARGGVDVSIAMADLGGELIAEIPEDPAMIEAENAHEPAAVRGDGSAAREVRRLAQRLLRDVDGVVAR